jgi:hypothetical protein
MPKKWEKTEKCSRKLVSHFIERLFLGIGFKSEKKY